MTRRLAKPRITRFRLPIGRVIGGKYVVEEFLGRGYEGEVYRVSEIRTGLPRAAKLFFPHRNLKDREARSYAIKLERLRHCPIVIQYHHAETVLFQGVPVTCLISEYVDGMLLQNFITAHPGRRLPSFKALHLLHGLVSGIEQIHLSGEYHGDLHTENIMVHPRGIFFDLKVVDFFNYGRSNPDRRLEDLFQLVTLLYEMTGGRRHYRNQPPEIKAICRGLRRDLICRRFPSTSHLRDHLEYFDWTP
ncbi:MAG: protein kinase [Alphaproteobacteria bacterium]